MHIITNKRYKYSLELLDNTSDEFKFVKDFIFTTKSRNFTGRTLKDFKICKVVEKKPVKAVNVKRNNLMMFHGTSLESASGVLKKGFKNSKSGQYGKGVYMTECSSNAFFWAFIKNYYKNYNCIFVNEVLGSKELQKIKFSNRSGTHFSLPLRNPFSKYIYKFSRRQPTKTKYKKDSLGRRYVANTYISPADEYVADASVTIPRYLVLLETERQETKKKKERKNKTVGLKVN